MSTQSKDLFGSPQQVLRTRNGIILLLMVAGSLIYVVYQLYIDFSIGGNSWKQGDWLINELSGPIRRGLFGSALLHISDLSGLNPLLILILFQATAVVSIFSVVTAAAIKLNTPDKLLLLILSPGFLILFWFNDSQGSVRKELLVYLAFLPLVLAAMRGRCTLLSYSLSITAFGIAVLAHEGTVFFLPFLWAALWLVKPEGASMLSRVAIIITPGLFALGGGLYAALHTHVPDPGVICAEVLQRGLSPTVCDGAIAYVENTPEEAVMNPGRLLSIHFRSFLLIYAACLLSFRLLVQDGENQDGWFVAAVASGIAFLPLYLLAGDYGRWLNYHISSITFLALIFLLKWKPDWLFLRARSLDFFCLLVLYLIVGVSHSPGEMADGFLVRVVRITLF